MSTRINAGRFTAAVDSDFVVFLIGSRLNNVRDLVKMVRIARQMRAMQAELRQSPELGCLHMEDFFGRTTISVQYWRDAESLENYAKSTNNDHLPAWREYNRLVRTAGNIGIWHETYQVRNHESIYVNMPTFGLAGAGSIKQLGPGSTARQRLASAPIAS